MMNEIEKKSFLQYYDLDKYIETEVRDNFFKNESLTAFDFFCIIVWKAQRAQSRIATKVLKGDSDIEFAVKKLTNSIYQAKEPKEKFRILIECYKFQVPTASAILTVLYPEYFTVYDYRVCDSLKKHKNLVNKSNFENIWADYQMFINDVNDYIKDGWTLRDKDKALWGRSFKRDLEEKILKKFK